MSPPQASAAHFGAGWGAVLADPPALTQLLCPGLTGDPLHLQAADSGDPAGQHQSPSQHQGPGGQRQEQDAKGAAGSTPGQVHGGATTLAFGCLGPPSACWVSGGGVGRGGPGEVLSVHPQLGGEQGSLDTLAWLGEPHF